MMKQSLCAMMMVLATAVVSVAEKRVILENLESSQVDYPGFEQMTKEVKSHRASRLVSIEEFNKMASEPNTVILDTRSKENYMGRHIKGAIHLNFSEFSEKSLAKLIPDKNTRVLIYCNNNFKDDPQTMFLKIRPLALNIPTYINLYGYGYKNVYELKDYLSVHDKRVKFEVAKWSSSGLTLIKPPLSE